MKAKVFYIAGDQDKIFKDLAHLLRNVYENIQVVGYPIDKNVGRTTWNKELHANCEEYVRLLRKAVLTINDFSIVLKQRQDPANWFYLGYEYNKSESLFTKYLELYNDKIVSIFPSVAILNRMIILPKGISDLFAKEKFRDAKFDYLFKPFELQGVRLIDFEYKNPEEIKDHFIDIHNQLKNEIKQYFARYNQQVSVPKPDLGRLFELLDIDSSYFLLNKKEFETQNINFDIVTKSSSLRVNSKSKVKLRIENKSHGIKINSVNLELTGPKDCLNAPISKSIVFDKTTHSCEVEFEIKPITSPWLPIELKFTPAEPVQNVNFFPIPHILNVEK
jgi:hypothetical protein